MIATEGRRFDLENQYEELLTGSHRIVTGWDVREKGAGRPKPQRLRGFIVVRNTRNSAGGRTIDLECMRRIGFGDEKNILKAIAGGMKAEDGLLPTTLEFVIMQDAIRRADGQLEFIDTFDDYYAARKKGFVGYWCKGDGVNAIRQREDGTRFQCVCNPVGKVGIDAKDYCPESVKKECKAHEHLVVGLVWLNPRSGRYEPLSSIINSRYHLHTTSERGGLSIKKALVAAARRLSVPQPDGSATCCLYGINGTLIFNVANREYKDAEGNSQTAIAGSISCYLNEEQIRDRERQMREARMKGHLLDAPASPAALLSAPASGPPDTMDLGEVEIEPEEQPKNSPVPSPDTVTQAPQNAVFDPGACSAPASIIPVAEATAEELVDALNTLIKADAAAKNQPASEIAKALCDPIVVDGKPYAVTDPMHYLKAKGKSQQPAAAALRSTCERIEASADERFVVLRAPMAEGTTEQ